MSDEQRTDYRARRMGFVFQFYNLMPVLTAVENVELPLLVARVPAKEARRKALAALDLVGLGNRARTSPTSSPAGGGLVTHYEVVRAADVGEVLRWAEEHRDDRTFTPYLLVRNGGGQIGLARLHGTDPTRTE